MPPSLHHPAHCAWWTPPGPRSIHAKGPSELFAFDGRTRTRSWSSRSVGSTSAQTRAEASARRRPRRTATPRIAPADQRLPGDRRRGRETAATAAIAGGELAQRVRLARRRPRLLFVGSGRPAERQAAAIAAATRCSQAGYALLTPAARSMSFGQTWVSGH